MSEHPDLPPPKGKLAAIFQDLDARPEVRRVLIDHLVGGTAATLLAHDLTASGWPIGATAIKDYRAAIRLAESEKGCASE